MNSEDINFLISIQDLPDEEFKIAYLERDLENKEKEIERLNNIIDELEKWLKEEQVNSVDIDEWTIIQVRDKILELKGSE